MQSLRFSICIPTYNGRDFIGETLKSILSQGFTDFEIIISDDCSTDNTEEVVRSFRDERIRYFRNETNLGYGDNLNMCCAKASGDILFLMGHDDILLEDALQKTCNAFMLGEDIGVVTRPYYWFEDDFRKPVRAILPYDKNRDTILSIFDGERQFRAIIDSVGQLSGLAYRKKFIDIPFHKEIFPAHIWPFMSILKRYRCVYLRDFTVAVRIGTSMTRFKPDIYEISPTTSWVKMFNSVFCEERFKKVKRIGIKHMATHFLGLVQLKTYAGMRILLREILVLVRYRWQNIFNPQFWFFSLGCLVIPGKLLRILADSFKRFVLSSRLKRVIER